jgi:OmpA-OmpF porin, OOP family
MFMKRASLAALLAAAMAVSFTTMAQQMPDRGWYVGGSFGKTEDKEGCPTTSCDLEDDGWKIFAGYRLNRNFALEGAYADWGTFTAGGTFLGLPSDVKVDVSTWSAAALGILPLADRFELFGKAGISLTKVDGSGSVGGIPVSDSDDETELLWGFGAIFNVTRNLALRAEWERLDKSEGDMMSIGIQYRF